MSAHWSTSARENGCSAVVVDQLVAGGGAAELDFEGTASCRRIDKTS